MIPTHRTVYRVFNFVLIGLIVLIFSVVLTPALGVVGFLIPPVLVGTAYLVVSAGLEGLIALVEWVERLLAQRPILRSTDIHRFDYIGQSEPPRPARKRLKRLDMPRTPFEILLMDDGEAVEIIEEDDPDTKPKRDTH